MVVITCPECGAELDSDKMSFESHCISHWEVPYRDIYKLSNTEARRRYDLIMQSLPDKADVFEVADVKKNTVAPSDIKGGL